MFAKNKSMRYVGTLEDVKNWLDVHVGVIDLLP